MSIETLASLTFAGQVSIVLVLVAMAYSLIHLSFYWKIYNNPNIDKEARRHTLKIAFIVFSIFCAFVSILAYTVNVLFFDAGNQFRPHLKWFQNVTVALSILALFLLRYFYTHGKKK